MTIHADIFRQARLQFARIDDGVLVSGYVLSTGAMTILAAYRQFVKRRLTVQSVSSWNRIRAAAMACNAGFVDRTVEADVF